MYILGRKCGLLPSDKKQTEENKIFKNKILEGIGLEEERNDENISPNFVCLL